MHVPCAEQGHVECGPAHLGAMDTHQPGPRLRVAQHERVAPVIAGVGHVTVGTRLTGVRGVAALKGQPVVGTAAVGERADADVGGRRRGRKEFLGLLQPAPPVVEVQRGDDFLVDLFVGGRVTERPTPEQADENQFVA